MTMVKRNRLRNCRKKAVFGADGAIMAAATLAAAGITAGATAAAAKSQSKAVIESAKTQAQSVKDQTVNNNNSLDSQSITQPNNQNIGVPNAVNQDMVNPTMNSGGFVYSPQQNNNGGV